MPFITYVEKKEKKCYILPFIETNIKKVLLYERESSLIFIDTVIYGHLSFCANVGANISSDKSVSGIVLFAFRQNCFIRFISYHALINSNNTILRNSLRLCFTAKIRKKNESGFDNFGISILLA